MKTYLIFFGKSQDFSICAFDTEKHIENFNLVINDFDLLESKIFTVDAIDNKEILSKYHFLAKDGRSFSMLKLYSFAQAYSGDRIAGSIYGVALISENDLSLSQINLNILRSAKSNFAKLCLNGLKFKVSDFKEEVFKIWGAFVHHQEGNYLNKVTITNRNAFNPNLGTKGFYVKSLFEDAVNLDNQMISTSRIYISEDLAHLKRANAKWGNDFPIYTKSNNGYELYREPQPIQNVKAEITANPIVKTTNAEQLPNLKHKIADLEEEIDHYKDKLHLNNKKNRATIIILSLIAFLFLAVLVFIYVKSESKDTTTGAPNPVPRFDPAPPISIKINQDNIRQLEAFVQAAKYIYLFDPQKSFKDISKLDSSYSSIASLPSEFHFDNSSIEEKYVQNKDALQHISLTTTVQITDQKKGHSQEDKKTEKITKSIIKKKVGKAGKNGK
jgi:hypothetical protein